MSDAEAKRVIVITGDGARREFDANGFTYGDDGFLTVTRDGTLIAVFIGHAWVGAFIAEAEVKP